MTAVTTGSGRMAIWCAASAAFLTGLDGSVVAVSLPTISQGFGSTIGTATWVTAGYMVALSCALLPSGRLLDRCGPWRFFAWGFIGFVLASAGCGFSSSVVMLIVMRCLQGLTAGMLIVSAFAVIPRSVPEAERAGAFATLTVLASLGVSLGGPVGGILSQYASWRWIFLINLPVGLIAARQAKCFSISLQEHIQAADRPIDLISIMSSVAALGSAMIGLNRGDTWGWTSPYALGFGIFSLLAALLFLHRERLSADPLLAWDAMSAPVIRRGFIVAAVAYLYFAGLQFLFPFDLVDHRHFSSSQVGGAMLAYSLPLMGAGAVSGRMSRTLGLPWSQALAMLFVLAGSLVLAFASEQLALLGGMAGCGIGFGLFTSPNNAAVMSAAAPGDQGRVAGSFQAVVRVSIACGVVLFEALHRQLSLMLQNRYNAVAADALAFRSSYLTGAVLCLLVAVFALYFKPTEISSVQRGA